MSSTQETLNFDMSVTFDATQALVFSVFLPDARADPYALYERLRTEAPLLRSPLGFWMMSRYTDSAAVLPDRRFIMIDPRDQQNPLGLPIDQEMLRTLQDGMARTMLFKNPPDHTRLRGLVSRAFTPRMIDNLRLRIHEIVHELLDAARAVGSMDLIADFAYPLPVIVIAELLGVPVEDRLKFRAWSRDLAPTVDPIITPEGVERGYHATQELGEYFRALIDKRRSDPRNDLLSALITASDAEQKLSEEEVLSNTFLLLSAGHETTTNLIGNGTLALLRNPDQWEHLQRNPALLASAVEELLRYDSPVQMTGRKASVDIEVGGATIAQGDLVIILIGAANRDPAHFTASDTLDITRSDNDHLTFGGGIHYCLGASLARLEGQIALGALTQTFPHLQLQDDDPQWRETITLRGLKALPVTF